MVYETKTCWFKKSRHSEWKGWPPIWVQPSQLHTSWRIEPPHKNSLWVQWIYTLFKSRNPSHWITMWATHCRRHLLLNFTITESFPEPSPPQSVFHTLEHGADHSFVFLWQTKGHQIHTMPVLVEDTSSVFRQECFSYNFPSCHMAGLL
jgi:hypothetical protein